MVLKKYGLEQLDFSALQSRIEGLKSESLKEARYRLNQIEGKLHSIILMRFLSCFLNGLDLRSESDTKLTTH